MDQRTRLTFEQGGSIWPQVEQWARGNGFNLKSSSAAERLYQKGHGLMVAPMMLSIGQTDGKVVLEAWVRCNAFTRLMSLFILPSEIGIQSGGFKAVLPRSIARNAVNILLQQLGQPPIP
jgi:hypothetical protein